MLLLGWIANLGVKDKLDADLMQVLNFGAMKGVVDLDGEQFVADLTLSPFKICDKS